MKIRRETLERISGWIMIYVGPVEYEKIVEEETGRAFSSPDNNGINNSEDILILLTDLSESEKGIDHEQLFKVICRSVHPLASKFSDNAEFESERAIRKFNEWLKYDGLRITKRGTDLVMVPSDNFLKADDVTVWPDDYNWNENKSLYQTEKGVVQFGAQRSIVKTIFGILVERKGEWVKVADLAKAVDKLPNYIRTDISNLKTKVLNKGLRIESSGNGKYRILPA